MSKLFDSIGQFASIPHSVIRKMSEIGPDAMALFVYLRYRTNNETEIAFPSYNTIQKDTGLTRRRIAQAIRKLESAEILERKRRFGASTLYTLKLPLVQQVDYSKTPLVQQSDYISPAGELSLVQQVNTTKIESTKIESTKKDSRKRAPANDDLLITSISHGQELQEALIRVYDSKGRKAPTHFQNVLQKEAYEVCAVGLNGKFLTAVNDGLGRGRESRDALLSTLKAWLRNEQQPQRNYHGQYQNTRAITQPIGSEIGEQQRADALALAAGLPVSGD